MKTKNNPTTVASEPKQMTLNDIFSEMLVASASGDHANTATEATQITTSEQNSSEASLKMELIKKEFEAYFSNWKIELPDKNLNDRLNGYLNKSGWLIQYCFGIENGMEYLDFYASHRMTNDRHIRIYENGETEGLPSYWESFVVDSDGQGKKKYEENNKKVTKMLIEKGFDKFTINMALQSGMLEE